MGALNSALLASVRKRGADRSRPFYVGAKTASYTLLPSDCQNGVVTNEGAAGEITFTLPVTVATDAVSPFYDVVGMRITVVGITAQGILIDPAGTETIEGLTAGHRLSNTPGPDLAQVNDSVTLVCTEPGFWSIVANAGAWATEGS